MNNTATHLLALHLQQLFFGGNWTSSNVKDALAGISLAHAQHKIANLNTIAALAWHINYYVEAILNVCKGNQLIANDAYSYDVPHFNNEQEWQFFIEQMLNNAAQLYQSIISLSPDTLSHVFCKEQYGTWHRNIAGLIEHSHYHLGQICLLKKLLGAQK
jgi:uncharacterized damage-inducible protein DinB